MKNTTLSLLVSSIALFFMLYSPPENVPATPTETVLNHSVDLIYKCEGKTVENCQELAANKFLKRWIRIADNEYDKYRIPKSVKLAQGMLESNFGRSRCSKLCNNWFGVKNHNKPPSDLATGNCLVLGEGSPYRKYKTAWSSWRGHSELLLNKRYEHLIETCGNNYFTYARGLKKAGYATDKDYPKKLIRIIEKYELYKLDGLKEPVNHLKYIAPIF